jgi:hypothetical protein
MKIEIELSRAEEIYLTTCCIGRVANSVIKAVPNNYEFMQDLLDLNYIVEPLRYKMADAIFRTKQDLAKRGE